jgi:hyperosmotically inducible protein
MSSYFARCVALLMIILSTMIAACTERQVDDAMLTARIKARMTADGRVSPSRVDVDTLNGDVTLRGEAPTQEEKDAAVDVARKVEGVRSVSNQIIVNPAVAGTGIPSGVEIKQQAEKAASDVGEGVKKGAEDAFLLGETKARLAAAGYGSVSVGVERGAVTLKGEVSKDKDRIAVEAIVEMIKGVEKVDNQLVVKRLTPTPTPTPTRSPTPSPSLRRRHPYAISHMRYAI